METLHAATDKSIDIRWRGFVKFGGISAIMISLLLLGEIVVYSILPRLETTLETFELFEQNFMAGLLIFDLLGMVCYLFFIPFILSLYFILRKIDEAIVLSATVLFFMGIAVFFATNTAFPMLTLSKQYTIAATPDEKSMLLAAGHAMITLFNVNAFLVSYVIVSASWAIISYVMLRSAHFRRSTSYAGIAAGLSGIIAEILENAFQGLVEVAILFYFAAIVFLIIWVAQAGLRLIRISKVYYE